MGLKGIRIFFETWGSFCLVLIILNSEKFFSATRIFKLRSEMLESDYEFSDKSIG